MEPDAHTRNCTALTFHPVFVLKSTKRSDFGMVFVEKENVMRNICFSFLEGLASQIIKGRGGEDAPNREINYLLTLKGVSL